MLSQLSMGFSGRFRYRYPGFFLGCFWIFGLMVGVFLFLHSGVSYGSFLPDSFSGSADAGERLILVLLPICITVTGILLDQHWLIYGCAFCKAFSYSFSSLCFVTAFGSGGWLMRFLFLFTDTLMCALWYAFWHKCLSDKQISFASVMFFSGAGLFAAGFDLRVISPLLMRIIYS